MPSHTRLKREKMVEILGGECVDCGGVLGLEIDHVEPLRGGRHIPRDERTWRDPEALELRCRLCHQKKTREDYIKRGWRFGVE